MIPVLIVDAGLALALLGSAGLVRPLRWLGLGTRRRAAAALSAGLALVLAGLSLPTAEIRLPGPPMLLDEVAPSYEFGEAHDLLIEAAPERIDRALREVTADEIRLFRLLTWLRSPRLPGRGQPDILHPTNGRPLLEVALGSGFLLLRDEPGRELVFGTLVCCAPLPRPRTTAEFEALERPGLVKAVMNFHLEPAEGAIRLRTQTRVHASDPASRRRFAAYWRLIYPGSAFIRRMWLRAVKRRAEAGD